MLQCSNYKGRQRRTKNNDFAGAVSRTFYQKLNRDAASAPPWRYERMEEFAGTPDLRSLLSLADKLRQLANDSHCRGDQALYLLTATALENRAELLAATLPPEKVEAPPPDPRLHKSVDVTI
jgi:hypothetical protein